MINVDMFFTSNLSATMSSTHADYTTKQDLTQNIEFQSREWMIPNTRDDEGIEWLNNSNIQLTWLTHEVAQLFYELSIAIRF